MDLPRRHYLTVSEAAVFLGVSVDTIRRYCDEGLLAHDRTAGGHRRIDRTAAIAAQAEWRLR